MSALEDIKARVERVPQVAPGVVSEEAADALKLIAALEAVGALHVPILEHGDPVGCRTCDWEADEEWPCQTLSAIAEALR